MKASKANPVYTTYVISGGQKYDLTSVVTSINISDREKQIAKSVTIKVANIQTDGQRLGDISPFGTAFIFTPATAARKTRFFAVLCGDTAKKPP